MCIYVYLCVNTNDLARATYNEVGYNIDSNAAGQNCSVYTYVLILMVEVKDTDE